MSKGICLSKMKTGFVPAGHTGIYNLFPPRKVWYVRWYRKVVYKITSAIQTWKKAHHKCKSCGHRLAFTGFSYLTMPAVDVYICKGCGHTIEIEENGKAQMIICSSSESGWRSVNCSGIKFMREGK